LSQYKCVRCGRVVENLPDGPVRCPSCSFRVLEKMRSEVVKEVVSE